MKLENFTEDMLGKARKVTVDKDKTTIVEGKGKKADLEKRKKQLEGQIENADADYKKKDLRKRLAKLTGGVGVIKVGAATETEIKENRPRGFGKGQGRRAGPKRGGPHQKGGSHQGATRQKRRQR